MKKVIVLMIMVLSCASSPKISLHNEEAAIIRYKENIYFVPAGKLVKIDLETGEVMEVVND